MKRILAGFLMSALCVVPAFAQVEPLAHVCTWLDTDDDTWKHVSTIPWRSSGLGIGYKASDPAIIASQAAEMRQYGIKPLLSWWGPDAPRGGDGYLKVWRSVVTDPPAAILYEGQGRLEQDRDGWWIVDRHNNAQTLRADLTHLYNEFWSVDPSKWYQRHGKFVVYLWPAHAMRGDLKSVLDDLPFRDRLYVVGTIFDTVREPTDEHLPIASGLDAVTGYGFYSKPLMGEYQVDPVTGRVPLTDDLIARYRRVSLLWQDFLARRLPGVELILPLELAFDDRNYPGRKNPTYEASPEQALKLIAEMHQMIDHFWVHCGNVAPIITYVSYSEHFEGTAMEPNDRYGDQWLQMVSRAFPMRALPPSSCVR